MANLNNIFAGLLTFIVMGGLLYLIYPAITSFVSELPDEIRIFALMAELAFMILALLALPLLMTLTDDKGQM